MVTDEDTSYNRRDGNQLHVEDSETGYSLALGHHEARLRLNQVKLIKRTRTYSRYICFC